MPQSGSELLEVVAGVSARSVPDAVIFAAVWGLFAGAAALGWRRRWLRHASTEAVMQYERNERR